MSDEKKPGPPPLDAERARLRALGHTDEEISKILVERALRGGGQSVPQQGALSNALASIVAVTNYVFGLFTSIPGDIATILDRSVPAPARGSAFAAVAVKAVVIGVLAFAGWQEWQHYIISAPKTAVITVDLTASQAIKAKEDAKVAAEVAAGQAAQAKKAEEDAKVAAEVARGQAAEARKKEAEAEYAEELAKGQKAQACTARMDMIAKTLAPQDWGAAEEDFNRDCNPKYGKNKEECAVKFKQLIHDIDTPDYNDNHPNETLLKKSKAFKDECFFGSEESKAVGEALERRNANVRKIISILDSLKPKSTETSAAAVQPDKPTETTEAREPEPSPTPTPSYSALATPEPLPTPTPSALALPGPVPTLRADAPRTYDNSDLAGNDLQHIPSDSMDACISACRDNSQCKGVTFDKWNKVCFLKSEGTTLWFNAHGVSALMDPEDLPERADAPMYILHVPGRGFPRTGDMSYAESADACEASCKKTSWCAADTFFRSSHECMMLRTTGEYFPNANADAGIKQQKKY